MFSLPAKLATAAVIALLALVLIAATTSALTHTLAAAARPTPTPPTAPTEPATPPPPAPVTPTPSDPAPSGPTQPRPPASPPAGSVADIPASLLPLYRHAASTCPGLSWTVLAAIGKVESDHGRSRLPGVSSGSNASGASGIMQFLPATFAAYAHNLPKGGARPPSPFNPSDAIHTAANYLCASGARDNRNLDGALWAYNHSRAYRDQVLAQARRYADADRNSPPGARPAPQGERPTSPGAGVSEAARKVLAFARRQIGQPYQWGGDGPTAGEGFDCSGLSKAAYAAAGITLPRTAQTQYNSGPRLPAGTQAQPGDLVFFGTPDRIHHVGIALGQGTTLMVHAPDVGSRVRIQDWRGFRDFAGLSRPLGGPPTV